MEKKYPARIIKGVVGSKGKNIPMIPMARDSQPKVINISFFGYFMEVFLSYLNDMRISFFKIKKVVSQSTIKV